MSKLPAWFSLENYHRIFTPADWANEIYFRSEYFFRDGKFQSSEYLREKFY
jgi:hypothetical protein